MKEREEIRFSDKDLWCEAFLFFVRRGDLMGATQILVSGYAYNQAKQSGDVESICQAYKRLHFELKLFKRNYLNRGKGHW